MENNNEITTNVETVTAAKQMLVDVLEKAAGAIKEDTPLSASTQIDAVKAIDVNGRLVNDEKKIDYVVRFKRNGKPVLVGIDDLKFVTSISLAKSFATEKEALDFISQIQIASKLLIDSNPNNDENFKDPEVLMRTAAYQLNELGHGE